MYIFFYLCQRKKIKARSFVVFSLLFSHTSDRKQFGADPDLTKFMPGLIDDVQQDIRHLRTRRKSQTKSQCQNRKPDYVMVVWHRSSYHLHEQQIFQRRIWKSETQENCQRAERGTHNDRWNCNSGAERIRLQDRYFNVGYTPSHDDRHYLRYDCHYSRNDRSSSQNCSSANYSPPVKHNIPKCYCYRIDIDFSNEQHAWRNSPYHNDGRNNSPSPYAPLQPKYSSNGREHYIITEKAPKDIHIKVYTQQVKAENR